MEKKHKGFVKFPLLGNKSKIQKKIWKVITVANSLATGKNNSIMADSKMALVFDGTFSIHFDKDAGSFAILYFFCAYLFFLGGEFE